MRATIKMLKSNVDYVNKETGETVKDFQGVYCINRATPEELETYKQFKADFYREDDVTKEPLYFNRGIAPVHIEVKLITTKAGKQYDMYEKPKELLFLEQQLEQAKASGDDFDRKEASAELKQYKRDMLKSIDKHLANNTQAASTPLKEEGIAGL